MEHSSLGESWASDVQDFSELELAWASLALEQARSLEHSHLGESLARART